MMGIDKPHGGLSAENARRLDEIGPKWADDINGHRDFVIDVYSPVVARADNAGISVRRDIAYGAHGRNMVDVFTPADGPERRRRHGDIVLFVHGGAFVRGSKSRNGHIYDNVCYWFARQGYVAVNVEYRLAHDAPYPGGAEDVARAADWAVTNLREPGAPAPRVLLVGHSAGGTHVATCVFDPAFRARPVANIGAVVLVSARLRADVHPDNPNAAGVKAYFGENAGLYEERSPVTHAHCADVPLMIVVAEYENPYLDRYGAEFFHRASQARAIKPRFVQMKGHNHTSIVAHFNSGEETLGAAMVGFFDDLPAHDSDRSPSA
ncbi:lipase [Burkholderia sp. WAC0059]|uniref:alpha/beta hydrolase n=1 Tax=Burkholderia sp. WAC0059 TaxID=2066022 RepID=UPI000C7E86C5|nr:alpha/beta hydrolase [Burkholderia sp. WAC0059]PLZ00590.1 lipase [Burkholderia sp. WAC0059]